MPEFTPRYGSLSLANFMIRRVRALDKIETHRVGLQMETQCPEIVDGHPSLLNVNSISVHISFGQPSVFIVFCKVTNMPHLVLPVLLTIRCVLLFHASDVAVTAPSILRFSGCASIRVRTRHMPYIGSADVDNMMPECYIVLDVAALKRFRTVNETSFCQQPIRDNSRSSLGPAIS